MAAEYDRYARPVLRRGGAMQRAPVAPQRLEFAVVKAHGRVCRQLIRDVIITRSRVCMQRRHRARSAACVRHPACHARRRGCWLQRRRCSVLLAGDSGCDDAEASPTSPRIMIRRNPTAHPHL
jgi:hypothetical protein